MTAAAISLNRPEINSAVAAARNVMVWLIFACSFVVIFEPAPTDLLLIVSLVFFLLPGLPLAVAVMPLLLMLLLYIFGAFTSHLANAGDTESQYFVMSLCYMASSAIFVACFIAEDTEKRFALIKSGYIFGATVASIIALWAYVDVSGFGRLLVHYGADGLIFYGRATGAFRDPNVFSTYLVWPTIAILQGFITGTNKRPLLNLFSLCVIFPALFLAFSRGAWINASMAISIVVLLTFCLTGSSVMRGRIVLYAMIGAFVLGVAIAILLSIPAIEHIFLDRFTLVKSYDAGERGRFGNQINALPMLLQLPFGFGPYQFGHIFGLAPHNTFLNAFASCGWLGGLTYFTLICCNLFVGARTVFTKSPFQNQAILVYACLIAVMFQGVQIDTEHWRHFYWMMGMMWGLFAASLKTAGYQRLGKDSNAPSTDLKQSKG